MKREKASIILCQGHLYLFWTTGLYYTAQLLERFDVILLVPESYRDNQRFQHVSRMLDLHNIEYYSFVGHSYSQHKSVAKQCKALIERYKPAAVVQHDYIGIENMYLFHFAGRSNAGCKRIVVLSSMPSTVNTRKILKSFLAVTADRLSRKFKIPTALASPFVTLVKYAVGFYRNYFLPTLVLRTRPYFGLSLHNNIDIVPKRPLFDSHLVYQDCEQAYLQSLFAVTPIDSAKPSNPQFPLVRFPAKGLEDLQQRLYGSRDDKQLVLLPSLIGIRTYEDERKTLEKWTQYINLLKTKLPLHRFLIKFHPGIATDRMQRIESFFKKRCPYLDVVSKSVIAEKLIWQSEYVIGDVSTTLWWADFIGGRLAISIDMQDFPTSADMSQYPQIFYLKTQQELADADLIQRLECKLQDERINEHPTVAKFVADICKI